MATYSYTKYIDDDRLALEIRNSHITIALDEVVITGEETVDVKFKADLSDSEKATLDTLIYEHINQPIVVRDSVELAGIDITSNAERAMKVASTKLEGSSTQKLSHDFCDATTWYTDSVRIDAEELTTSDNLTYRGTNPNWIDLEHGKVPYENRLAPNYKPIFKVNGAVVTEGYSLDYTKGEVTFTQSKAGSSVTADYSYATESTWIMAPSQGKILKILGTTIKFTSDVILGDGQSINFQLFVGGNPYGEPTVYKNIKDILKCTMSEPACIKGFGDVTSDVYFLPFDYITSKDIKSSIGMDIRIWVSDHKVCAGEFGMVSANCLSVAE